MLTGRTIGNILHSDLVWALRRKRLIQYIVVHGVVML